MGRWAKVLLCAALAVCLTACAPKEYTGQIFAMDTFMQLTVYGDGDGVTGQQALQSAQSRVYELEAVLSVTWDNSDVHKINAGCGQIVTVDEDTAALLSRTLELCEETGGALDITAYPAVRAWGFTTGEHRVPESEELAALAEKIDYTQVKLEETGVILPEDVQIDLGAVAKGFTGDVLADQLRKAGIKSACLSLGGNIHTIGANPEGKPWRVGIQHPTTGGALAAVEVTDKAVVTSGNYQRYFEENGETYWHILDPDTAAPARSGLVSVSIIGSEGTRCDALSTALFVMGLDKAEEFWREHGDFEAVFVTDEEEIYITGGLKSSFSLLEPFQDLEVRVIE